ncbi:hypothetical protein HYS96_04840 [Candidatus Daviesbacteria bacterium]|nr:hypothetical protein [Candidatus Daviesbacteria bacterium]
MANNKLTGDLGEKEVCELIPCPNCGKELVLLPAGFPMYDIQCSRCLFRAQVKTVSNKPQASIYGAGWDIYEKVLKAGHLSPPLFINFRWETKAGFRREIRFYPFIAKGNIQKYQLSSTARRANYKMFKYVKLDRIPYMILHTLLDPLKRK